MCLPVVVSGMYVRVCVYEALFGWMGDGWMGGYAKCASLLWEVGDGIYVGLSV